ncbi:MAG: hypothetical protein AAGA02_17135 [Bacteroidota bacterium]
MIDRLKSIVGKKVQRLFFVVWPPFGEEDKAELDISAGYVFEEDPNTLYVISTDKDDLTTPCINYQSLPKSFFNWADFEIRMDKWMNCTEGMEMDTEYYEVTGEGQFSNIAQNKVVDIELVGVSNEDAPIGIKLIFENDYILSTPITDGNTIESAKFNRNNNLDNFLSLGNIKYSSIKDIILSDL